MLKRKFSKIAFLAAFVAFTGVSTNSFAADAAATGFGIGGNIGFGMIGSSAAGSTSQSGLAFGGQLMYRLDPTWEIDADWTYQSYTVATFTSTVMTIMAEGNYHLAADLSPLYFGLRAGVVMASTPSITILGITIPGTTTSNFAFGAQVGYDFTIVPNLTIGPKVAFDYILSSPSSGTDFQALASIRYHF